MVYVILPQRELPMDRSHFLDLYLHKNFFLYQLVEIGIIYRLRKTYKSDIIPSKTVKYPLFLSIDYQYSNNLPMNQEGLQVIYPYFPIFFLKTYES